MNQNEYIGGLCQKHQARFIPDVPIQLLTSHVLGFKLMESSFYVKPKKPSYLTKIKVVKKNLKKSVAFSSKV